MNLETKNYVNKTIPKLVDETGILLENQQQILKEAKKFYQNLYSTEISNNVPYM